MRAQIEQVIGDCRRDPESSCGIFSIDHHQIRTIRGNHLRQVLTHNAPSGTAKNIANKKNPQSFSFSRA